jgi:hypothetical protein
VAATGWEWDYVEETLDFPRLLALREQWARHPPVHILLAAFVGYKPKKTSADNSPQEVAALFDMLRAAPPTE